MRTRMYMSVGSSFARLSSGGDLFGRLLRYESSLERSFFRTLHELERIQRRRLGEAVDAPKIVDVDVRTEIGAEPASSDFAVVHAVDLETTQAIQPPDEAVGPKAGACRKACGAGRKPAVASKACRWGWIGRP